MNHHKSAYDVLIIGASASGLMCAIEAGRRGRSVLVLDHANRAGKKILMSGGGRCNFTNYHIDAENYLSSNPHFCKSALSRFSQWDFIDRVQRHGIEYHERDHGQLFCNNSATDILNMLLDECRDAGVNILLECTVNHVTQCDDHGFAVDTSSGRFQAQSLVIASGGLSIPKMCASPFGYQVAQQFGVNVQPTRAGLVPFTLHKEDKARFSPLSGIAVDSHVSNERISFHENLLFTHRGLSGPAILQISSYWYPGETLTINLLPDIILEKKLIQAQHEHGKQLLRTWLAGYLPKRLIAAFVDATLPEMPLHTLNKKQMSLIADSLQRWQLRPNGTEGYRTAEVTLGGVDCDELSSKTMECKKVPGLYFIGEVMDVSGWLGGYNFQWAWSSGWVAGQYV